MEIFNTGFDADEFKIDVLQRAKAIIQVYDNDTGERILEDDGGWDFPHGSSLTDMRRKLSESLSNLHLTD